MKIRLSANWAALSFKRASEMVRTDEPREIDVPYFPDAPLIAAREISRFQRETGMKPAALALGYQMYFSILARISAHADRSDTALNATHFESRPSLPPTFLDVPLFLIAQPKTAMMCIPLGGPEAVRFV